jgi:hypothetical protein
MDGWMDWQTLSLSGGQPRGSTEMQHRWVPAIRRIRFVVQAGGCCGRAQVEQAGRQACINRCK